MKKISIYSTLFLTGILLLNSCKKEFDTPPLKTVNDGAQLSIQQLKARVPSSPSSFKFGMGDTNLYATIIADETSGNIYKQLFVKDDLGAAIQLNLVNSGGLFVGDRIRINLNKLYVINASSMIYIDSVDIEKSVVKISSGTAVTPKVVTMSEILAGTVPTNSNSLQGQLVQINNVEFIPNAIIPTFADAIGKATVNQYIKTCVAGQSLTVRSSGYANFASKLLPTGNGNFVAVVTQYNSTMQLTIRNYNEIQMTGPLCGSGPPPAGTYLTKNFDDNSITSGGWSSQNVNGTINWTTATFGNQTFAKITNFVASANVPCETWLISPALSLATSTNPILVFQNAYKFAGAPLQAYISTNYTSGAPSTATWTNLPFTLSSGNYVFVSSGNISLSAYKVNNVRIAFKYSGTSTDGSTWEIDDVLVKE
ncbi:MAG: DUF5689 domain-containing protein [Bacteroidota bacterium]|nr:DUF5689 domain-containing protein [Bacteroidota bacterium]MDP3146551.1 DUF5689 domain-containing protein [Bacteroidota bacterium]MDP3556769.1 DUF5689 domain-containing protein [Bacteroidota bacterium]